MYKRFGLALLVLALLSPLGLIAEGTAWGEWGSQQIQSSLGYVPKGLVQFGDLWQAFLPDYTIKVFGESILGKSAGYMLSAVLGSLLIYALSVCLTRLMLRSKNKTVYLHK